MTAWMIDVEILEGSGSTAVALFSRRKTYGRRARSMSIVRKTGAAARCKKGARLRYRHAPRVLHHSLSRLFRGTLVVHVR
jgi:hypothetical protein